jgi:thymidine phosphorylase
MNGLRHDSLRARRLGIDTYREPVAFLRADSPVCRAEGFRSMSRLHAAHGARAVEATLNVVVHDSLLAADEIGLSEAAWNTLGLQPGDAVQVSHAEAVDSFSAVRSKIYGGSFSAAELDQIVRDLGAGRYSSIQTAAFVTACAGEHMSLDETLGLTRAMVQAGTRLAWSQHPVVDKHCVGGLPGNRTTPIVVAIVAACGLTIPKTSSRAITSPAGTADMMETLAPVDLTLERMRRVVEREGGCVVWGGSMALSPADDILIQVERPLDFDSTGQLTASILSKKAAAGSTHLVIDIPVGPTAKVRDEVSAGHLSERLIAVGQALGMQVCVTCTDGRQPVGRGIGPVLEALDVLAVLRRDPGAPADLRAHALMLAGLLLELGGRAAKGQGLALASATLDKREAWTRFQAICEAQGGMRQPQLAPHRLPLVAPRGGKVLGIDCRRLARVAKLAGAPLSPAAGLEILVKLDQEVQADEPMFVIHAQTPGELDYAAHYAAAHPGIVALGAIA